MPTTVARPPRTPANGPTDPRLYLTVIALIDCDLAGVDPAEGVVWVGNTADRKKYRIEVDVIDRLAELKWVDLDGEHDAVKVLERGGYWANRFIRANGG